MLFFLKRCVFLIKKVQTYGSLLHQIQTFNEAIFGCGFYYYWAYDHKRAMRENRSPNKSGKTLVVYSMFDACYEHTFELYFKKCTYHDLPRDYWIPDHWHIPPLAIESIDFENQNTDEKENIVNQFTLRLYTSTAFLDNSYFYIKASAFYFDKIG